MSLKSFIVSIIKANLFANYFRKFANFSPCYGTLLMVINRLASPGRAFFRWKKRLRKPGPKGPLKLPLVIRGQYLSYSFAVYHATFLCSQFQTQNNVQNSDKILGYCAKMFEHVPIRNALLKFQFRHFFP